MRVVHLTAFGGPEVLKPATVPDRSPARARSRIDLVRAALNHREVWIREGRPGPLPAILGSDGAGVVSAGGARRRGRGGRRRGRDQPFARLGRGRGRARARASASSASPTRAPTPSGSSVGGASGQAAPGRMVVGRVRRPPAGRPHGLAGAAAGRRRAGPADPRDGRRRRRRHLPRPDRRSARRDASAQQRGQTPRLRARSSWAPRRRSTTTTRSGRSGSARSTPRSTAPAARASTPSSGRSPAAASSSASATRPASRRRSTWPRSSWNGAGSRGRRWGARASSTRSWRTSATAKWRPVIDSTFPLEDAAGAHRRLVNPERTGKVVLAIR